MLTNNDFSQVLKIYFLDAQFTFELLHTLLKKAPNYLIVVIFFTISLLMVSYASKKKNIPFRNLFVPSLIFITLCGILHFFYTLDLNLPFQILNFISFLTAAFGAYTIYLSIRIFPDALKIKNTEELDELNANLKFANDAKEFSDKQLFMDFEFAEIGKAFVDLSGNFIRTNKAFCDILGYSKEELLKLDFEEITHIDDYHDHKNLLNELQEGKLNFTSFQKRYMHQNGKVIWLLLNVVLIRDEDANPAFMVVQIQDVSEKVQTEEELKISQARFELVILGAQAGIWEWPDINCNKEWWSPKFYDLLGYEIDEIPASLDSFYNLLHPDDREATQDLIDKHFRKEAPFIIEYRLKTKSGKYKWFQGSGQAEFDANGNALKMAGSIIDITPTKQAEKKLIQKNQELEVSVKNLASFSYSISHDLKTPLRAISGFCGILLEDHAKDLNDEGKKILNTVIKNSNKMGTLINDLLTYSMISRKNLKLYKLDMKYMFESSIRNYTKKIPEKNYNFIVQPLKKAVGDKVMIEHLLNNLVSNTIKYAKKEVPINIEVEGETTDEGYTYKIKDNGVGFDSTYIHKIFGVFERLHKESEFQGTGVGLAIAKKVVEIHGGKIWAESEIDVGSTFYFTLDPNIKTEVN